MESSGSHEDIEYLTGPLEDVYGHGIPFFSPYSGKTTTLKNLEKAFKAGVKAAGLSIDLKEGPSAHLAGERWLADIIERSPVPLIIKGILTPDNAARAADAGARGIVVSNRGGRLLESVASGVEMLPEIKSRTGDTTLLLVDGGIRSGEDVFKALALGADLALIGRPIFIYACGAGEEGIFFYLSRIQNELKQAMLVAGAKTVNDICMKMLREK